MATEIRTLCDVFASAAATGKPNLLLSKVDGQWRPISAKDFVNREEPLTNLLEVMRHLMSHNGHMKTAIIP